MGVMSLGVISAKVTVSTSCGDSSPVASNLA